jgi:HK97 family phage major capsid protein
MTKMMNPGAVVRGIVAVRADASGDVKTILASLQKDWADFKSEQDEAVKALKKGQEDVVKSEKIDRINASVSELQAAVDQANAKLAALSIAGTTGTSKDPEYNAAFNAHFRKGDVQAALNKGTASEGGYLAPVEWDRTITDKLVQVSPMRQIAQVQNISGAGFSKLFNARGMGSGWVGETAARPQTSTPTIGTMTYTPGEIYANPAATQGFLDDAAVDVEQWIANEVESEFAYQEGLAFISGTGVNKPAGFLTYVTGASNAAAHPWGAIPTAVTAASAVVFTADELISLVYDLPNEFQQSARFVTNRNVVEAARKLKDANGAYLWQPSFQAGQPQQILGYPVTEMPGMPDPAANSYPIAFGDFRRGYLIVDRMGIRVLRDPYTNKPYVHFYTTKRVGGGLLNPEVLRVLRMAAV